MKKVQKYSWKERLSLPELYQTFLGLEPREQLLSTAGIIIVLALLIFIPFSCASSRLDKLESQIANYTENIDKVEAKIQEYNRAQQRASQLEKEMGPRAQAKLITKIESLINKSQLKDFTKQSFNERTRNPTELSEELFVKVEMSGVTLMQLVDFLHKVESQPGSNLKVNRISIKTDPKDRRKLKSVDFDVSTLISKGEDS